MSNTPATRPHGHPSSVTLTRLADPDARDAFLESIVEEGSIAGACRVHDLHRPSVFILMAQDAGFAELVRPYRIAALEGKTDECIDIADDDSNDGPQNPFAVQRDRLKIETRLKIIGKLNQTVWGEKPQTQVTVNTSVGIVCTEEQRARLIAMREALNVPVSIAEKAAQARTIDAEVVTPDYAQNDQLATDE